MLNGVGFGVEAGVGVETGVGVEVALFLAVGAFASGLGGVEPVGELAGFSFEAAAGCGAGGLAASNAATNSSAWSRFSVASA